MICKCDYHLSDIIIILIPRITCTIGRTFPEREIVNTKKEEKKENAFPWSPYSQINLDPHLKDPRYGIGLGTSTVR